MAGGLYPLEEIKDKCDLAEIISRHVALRKNGARLTGLCPFHHEKTPSFYVSPDRGIWKCFGCGEGGDVFAFVQKIDNLSFGEAVEQLAKQTGIEIRYDSKTSSNINEKDRLFKANNAACRFFIDSLASSNAAKQYLSARGITPEAISKYRIGFAPAEWDGLVKYLTKERVSMADAQKAGLVTAKENGGFYDKFRDRLIIPITDASERIIGFGGRVIGEGQPKYINSPETLLFKKNKVLYGLSNARKTIVEKDQVIVVEGYMDCITCQIAGFNNTVATMGTAITPEHAAILKRYANNAFLALDSDSAGLNAALRSAPIFEQAELNVRILNIPPGEDPDSMLRNGDISRFAKAIEKAMPLVDFRIKQVFKKHDLKSQQGRVDALNDSIRILTGLENTIERERIIRLLAKYHPNFGSGNTDAEKHIRQEVIRIRNIDARKGVVLPSNNISVDNSKPNQVLTLTEKIQRSILGELILKNVELKKVFDEVLSNLFTVEANINLYNAIIAQYNNLGRIDSDTLHEYISDSETADLLNNILISEDDPDFNHPIDDLITELKSKQRRKVVQKR